VIGLRMRFSDKVAGHGTGSVTTAVRYPSGRTNPPWLRVERRPIDLRVRLPRRQTPTGLHAQSLQGISTIAWGCHSAAPATPGDRPPTSAQLCRSCLRSPVVGQQQHRQPGPTRSHHRVGTKCVECQDFGIAHMIVGGNDPARRVANSFRVERWLGHVNLG
jgi:hypothetical protein